MYASDTARSAPGLLASSVLLSFVGSATGAEAGNAEAGSTWVVTRATGLRRLSVGETASIEASEGHSVTVTVNGVETVHCRARIAGMSRSRVSENNVVSWRALLSSALACNFRQALYIDARGGRRRQVCHERDARLNSHGR